MSSSSTTACPVVECASMHMLTTRGVVADAASTGAHDSSTADRKNSDTTWT
eukprot:CAMPEP_0206466356 /NCGR_PEP_ID=MMETSP0324_2-20121206/28408_1 /ASSEMBLY_ACC=CAM_ASM_000836 /TAXON_ID=2866 /ORGANISM="Crypthecodinium cohnii, Strain Seligo" /LENGTH=50 /DNA_ID=CAMNT_0053939453 /DNA_START=172 /DNA_END=325 /DNA_ORIENTATION=-